MEGQTESKHETVICESSGRTMSRSKYERIYRREYGAAMKKWARLGLSIAAPARPEDDEA